MFHKYHMRKYINIIEEYNNVEFETIPKGATFYHGSDDDFYPHDGTWISNSKKVAEYFAKRASGNTIYKIETTKDLSLLLLDQSNFNQFLEDHNIDNYGAEDLRDGMLKTNYDGWIIKDNYGYGEHDIFICDGSSLKIIE